MYSQIVAFGRLTRDPELRYVTGKEGQVAVCNITIACDDYSRSGEKKTGFLDFVFWAGAGEAIAKHLVKGDPIFATGSARTETWTDEPSGQQRSRLRFRGRDFKFCPRVATRASASEGTEIAPTTQVGEARRQPPYQPPPPSGFTPDDDIPF